MKLGPYSLTREAALSVGRNFIDAQRVILRGIPRLRGKDPREIAAAVLHTNAQQVLNAGQGHFHYMWTVDFGKALRGAYTVLPGKYLSDLIGEMIEESGRLGAVPSCFSSTGGFHGFNMPYDRGDSLPWLIHGVYERHLEGKRLQPAHRKTLQELLTQWEATQLEGGLVALSVTGDWMDTVLRPSSTYNNLCALHMLQLAPRLGLKTATDPAKLEKAILADRLRRDHFTDHAGTEREGVDAAVLALYLELFDTKVRTKLADRLQKSSLDQPYPIRASAQPYPRSLLSPLARTMAGYHNAIWLHLGFMYLNGLKRLGRDVAAQQASMEALVMQYGNFLETLAPSGKPYRAPFLSTEYGLTMAAGQYLELIEN